MSQKDTKVVSIHSYKGGTGKTISVVNMAAIFASQGYNVVLLDMDFGAPSLYTYFPNSYVKGITTLNDVILRGADLEDAIINVSETLGSPTGKLFVGLASHQSDQTRQMVRRGVKEATKDAQKLFSWIDMLGETPYSSDIIFLDTAPGLNFLSVNSISACDISVLLLRLLNADLMGTKEMIQGLHSKLASEIMLVVNQLPPEYMQGEHAEGIESLIETYIFSHIHDVSLKFGGIIAKDMELVRLEADNMLQLLHKGEERRDIYALKHHYGSFAQSIQSVVSSLKEMLP